MGTQRNHTERRRAAALLLALAVGAVGCSDDVAPGRAVESPPATTTADVTPAEREDETGLPRGAASEIDVVRGTVLSRPDGTTIDLELDPEWGVSAVTRHRDRLYVTGGLWFEGTVNMSQLDADGTHLGSWGTTGPVVSSPEGDIAYVDIVAAEGDAGEERSSISLVSADGKHRTQRVRGQFMPKLVGFVDGEVVYNARFRTADGAWETGQFSTDLVSGPRRVKPYGAKVLSPGGDSWYENNPAPDDSGLIAISIGGHVDSMDAGTLHDVPGVWENDESLLFLRLDGERAALVRNSPGGVERVGEWTDVDARSWDVPVR